MFKDELTAKRILRTQSKDICICIKWWHKKKHQGNKKCVIKRKLAFENYKNCLLNNKIILRSQLRFKSDHHKVYTEETNRIALSSNDNKRIQTIDKVTTYPCGTSDFKICESEMLSLRK